MLSTSVLQRVRFVFFVPCLGRVYDVVFFFFSSRRRHTRCSRDWSSDVCSSDLGGKAHGRAIVFVNRGIAEVVSGSGKQFFVIQKAFGHGVETVGDHDNAFERGVFAKLFIDGIKHVVDKEKAVPSVLGDGGNFVGMKAQVQRMQDAAGAGNSEEGFQVARMIPHHGSYAVARFEAEFAEGRAKTAGATIEVPVTDRKSVV